MDWFNRTSKIAEDYTLYLRSWQRKQLRYKVKISKIRQRLFYQNYFVGKTFKRILAEKINVLAALIIFKNVTISK